MGGYSYSDGQPACGHGLLIPVIVRILASADIPAEKRRIFDLGCGNGSAGNELAKAGYSIFGVDPSSEGIAWANRLYPHLRLECGSSDDDLSSRYGQYPIVTSIEVIEHVFSPKRFAETLFSLVEPGGMAIITTPFHGYWKNLLISLAAKWDWHHTSLWEGGHIKFWSMPTLAQLLRQAGFTDIVYKRVGRIPPLAISMIAIARRRH